jgi:hypothetical protein
LLLTKLVLAKVACLLLVREIVLVTAITLVVAVEMADLAAVLTAAVSKILPFNGNLNLGLDLESVAPIGAIYCSES